jgi:hypothetical protein
MGNLLRATGHHAQPSDLTVLEGQPATFTIGVTNSDPVAYQWQRNGTNIPGANNQGYTIPFAALSDNGARFRARLTNALGGVFTSEATLTVVLIRSLSPSAPFRILAGILSVVFLRADRSEHRNQFRQLCDRSRSRVIAAQLEPDARTVTLDT